MSLKTLPSAADEGRGSPKTPLGQSFWGAPGARSADSPIAILSGRMYCAPASHSSDVSSIPPWPLAGNLCDFMYAPISLDPLYGTGENNTRTPFERYFWSSFGAASLSAGCAPP